MMTSENMTKNAYYDYPVVLSITPSQMIEITTTFHKLFVQKTKNLK